MTGRRMSAFIDALATGRRPRGFTPTPEEISVLRTAIELRAARPGEAVPDDQFVSSLYEELAAGPAQNRAVPMVRPAAQHRGRAALVAVAAAAALVGGTVATTEVFDHRAVAPAALSLPQGQELRTATLLDAESHALGQIVVYRGNPSWVYMNVNDPGYDGQVTCSLKAANGTTEMAGVFNLRDGHGEWSKTIPVNADQVGGAELVTSTGATLATATF